MMHWVCQATKGRELCHFESLRKEVGIRNKINRIKKDFVRIRKT